MNPAVRHSPRRHVRDLGSVVSMLKAATWASRGLVFSLGSVRFETDCAGQDQGAEAP